MDLYAILDLTHTANGTEIRDAYRRLAKRFHPDVSTLPDAHQRFIRLTEAYEVLSDPLKRKRYDLSRQSPHPFNAPPQQQPRYERDVNTYRRQARERAERFSRMDYNRFDAEYFDSTFSYVAPKMLGCFGIALAVLSASVILISFLIWLPIPEGVKVPFVLVVLLGTIPLVAWLSMRFDGWHNERQRRRRSKR